MGSLKLIKRSDSVIQLTISAVFRACCLFFSATILAGSIISQKFAVLPSIVALIAFIGGLYRENWTFDTEKQEVRSVFGVGPFVKKETITFSEIDRFEISHFVKGMSDIAVTKPKSFRPGRKAYLTFSIVLIPSDPETESEKRHDIEIIPESTSAGRTESNARSVASFCNINLIIDRERDIDPAYNPRSLR